MENEIDEISVDWNEDLEEIDPETAWLEDITIGGFRVWHILVFVFATLLSVVIMLCCCIRFRIPRTKQEIEADYQRKQITKKFREKLARIKNSEMDELDLPKALIKVQTELLSDDDSSDSLTKTKEDSLGSSNGKSNNIHQKEKV